MAGDGPDAVIRPGAQAGADASVAGRAGAALWDRRAPRSPVVGAARRTGARHRTGRWAPPARICTAGWHTADRVVGQWPW